MLEGKPQWFWLSLAGVVFMAVIMFAYNQWTAVNQLLLGLAVFVIFAASSNTGEKQKILPEEADRIALQEANRRIRRSDSNLEGPARLVPQMKKNYEISGFTDRTIAVQTSGDARKIMLIKVPLYKERNGAVDINEVTIVDEDWTTRDEPNIEVVRPDSLIDLMRIEKKAKRKQEEEAGVAD